MILSNELFQVPAPLNNFAVRWIHSDQTKGIDLIERQSVKGGVREVRRSGRAHGIDDFAPADSFFVDTRRDGIPVDKRERRAVVVHGDPRSTAGFTRRDYGATVHLLLFRGETGGARQLFIAVHPKAIALLSCDEGDGTHCWPQSAAG